jgi:hypothetical protein
MNKLQYFKKIILVILCLTGLNVQAQDSTAIRKIAGYSKHFAAFTNSYPQEKVYLHFDNSSYFLGETLWFKAYLVTADRNALSQYSKTLFVELITPEGNIIETKKLKIINGQCHGDFKFPTTKFAGFYEVRAYTRYMLNFDKNTIFSRVFPVYDAPVEEGNYKHIITERAPSQRIPQLRKEFDQKDNLNMLFFPEGGNLISGLKSKVAFKATGKNGENTVVSGSVFDEQGTKITDFNSEYQNMGVFEFIPGTGKYTVKANYQNKDYSFNLPQALPVGYTINISNPDDEKIDILIQKSPAIVSDPLGLSISCRGKLYGFEQVTIGEENAVLLSFNKKMLPTGVAQITLYNSLGEVLSERLVFVNHFSQMKIEMTQDKDVYKPYEKINLNFQLSDLRGKPIETTFSAAIHDNATTNSNPLNDNLLTNLLLSSELKGYIENPGYYFESNDESRRQALDLLLLTQGWSRYSWKQMAGVDPFVIKHPIEKELVIEGTVTSLILKQKKENVDVSMILMNDSLSQRGICKTDKDGKFNFAVQDFKGQASLILQTKENEKRKEKNILLDRNFNPEIKSYSFSELNLADYTRAIKDTVLSKDMLKSISDINKSTQTQNEKNLMLQEIIVKAKKKSNDYGPVKVNIVYKVDKELDKMIDTGDWLPADIYLFIEKMTKYYNSSNGKYKGKKVLFVKDNSLQLISGINALLSGVDNLSSSNSNSGNTNQMSTNTTGNQLSGNKTPGSTNQSSDNNTADLANEASYLPRLEDIESISVIEDFNSILKIYPNLDPAITDPTKTVLMILHTKKRYQPEASGIRNTKFDGYAYTKEFYSPRYEDMSLPIEKDYRRTIYWNPDVLTDKEGKASIWFSNNSSCKSLHVSAETVTSNGIIGVLNK